MHRHVRNFILAAAVSMAAVTQAAAGCCNCGVPCVAPGQFIPVVDVPDVVPMVPMYVVNQGPVYVGPGITTYPGYFNEYRLPALYPYVSVDYYYPQYLGWHGPYHRTVKRARTVSYRYHR